MSGHPDTHHMTRAEREACGCERCQESLRFSAKLWELVAAVDSLDRSVAELGQTLADAEDRSVKGRTL